MERWIIEADPRHTVRRMKMAMQGNAIRALVELITNSDDSYVRLEDNGKSFKGIVEIVYEKVGYQGLFAVRDYAEGMSLDDVKRNFKRYGAATSGMKTGKRVRGYFGQGATDALASMKDGKICTFKDGQFVECKLYIQDGKPMGEASDPVCATQALRNLHKIDENGTVAYFAVDPEKAGRVPQLKSVQEELANNYLLRKIMTNPRRKVILVDKNSGENRRLHYQMPVGKGLLVEGFKVSYRGYGDFPIRTSLWRADTDLTQAGDDRDRGLLVVDDEDAVLGISLFKYDNEPLAARFFGEVRIGRFRELLDKEEAVLSEERDGKELLLSEGIVFEPESVTLRPNQPRKIHLLVYVKVIEGGSQIVISSENESIHVSKNEIIVNEFNAAKHIAKYELEVWGEGAGQNGIITAECETHVALLDVRVRSKEEPEDRGRKGMFSDPEFDFDPDPLYRTTYSPGTGKVMIYVNFPSVKHYLGETCQFKKTLPAQVLIADLVAERCFLEIAKKKVESAATLTPEAVPDRIQRDFYDLLRKYGRKIHEVLVDRNLLEASRRV